MRTGGTGESGSWVNTKVYPNTAKTQSWMGVAMYKFTLDCDGCAGFTGDLHRPPQSLSQTKPNAPKRATKLRTISITQLSLCHEEITWLVLRTNTYLIRRPPVYSTIYSFQWHTYICTVYIYIYTLLYQIEHFIQIHFHFYITFKHF